MKNNELLKKYAGISTRIRRIFAYHYDQIQREVQTEIKEIVYNNLYDTLIDELKGTISRFQAQYNIQEINPYLQDILQNPEDLVSLSQHHKR